MTGWGFLVRWYPYIPREQKDMFLQDLRDLLLNTAKEVKFENCQVYPVSNGVSHE